MKAVILAGGLGTRISEETALRPKPMVEYSGGGAMIQATTILTCAGGIARCWALPRGSAALPGYACCAILPLVAAANSAFSERARFQCVLNMHYTNQ